LLTCIHVTYREGAWIRCKTPPVDLVAKYMVRLRFTSEMITRVLDAKKGVFDYRPDSVINKVTPNYVIAWQVSELFTLTLYYMQHICYVCSRAINAY